MERKVIFDEEAFDAKYIKGAEDECWLWTAFKNKNGYGQIHICKNGKWTTSKAHRVSLYRKLGYDNEFLFSKLHAGHTCANRACVNPNHLVPQTAKENIDEMKNRLGNSYNARGSAIGSSKLTEEQVLEIRAIEGKTHAEIAKEYGVGRSLITHIINRKRWQHI
tara:strand:+ start:186 stop:677 length:492 start_codon:yes stop_codon:yes gene_type:complete